MSHDQPDEDYNVYHGLLHVNQVRAEHRASDEGFESPRASLFTKEQEDILEAQFRAHPKPDSMTKRQLALQIKSTLPRVAVSRACRKGIPCRN